MKYLKSILYIIFVSSSILFASCEDETTEGMYRVTYFPTFEINGPEYMSLVVGTPYQEQGAIAREGDKEIEVTTSGSVDVTTPGWYAITYSATNEDGFSASTQRLIAVTKQDMSGTDLSGTYMRMANSRLATVTKLADGFYYMSDVWGSATSGGNPLPTPTYLINTEGNELIFQLISPEQPFGGNFGTGTVTSEGNLSLATTLRPANPVVRTNVWVKQIEE